MTIDYGLAVSDGGGDLVYHEAAAAVLAEPHHHLPLLAAGLLPGRLLLLDVVAQQLVPRSLAPQPTTRIRWDRHLYTVDLELIKRCS